MTSNALKNEKSPYLQQHADSPINWHPWGKAAFEKAKQEDKPIFLSIGYSTGHLCHLMNEESFKDKDVANVLNRSYIAIKVDREERPDIDAVYMTACRTITGKSGWPLIVIMTPDQKPLIASTYLPKLPKYGMMGLLELIYRIEEQWKNEKNMMLELGDKLTERIWREKTEVLPEEIERATVVNEGFYQFCDMFDDKNGGFGKAPKFPMFHNILFLHRYYMADQNEEFAREMIETTVQQMYRGGIFDHIGGGFARYSTDEKWFVPSFEKTLYDNALAVYTLLELYRDMGQDLHKKIAQRTLDYLFRELKDENGGFYCGQDSESNGKEGDFYRFTYAELMELLGEEDGEYFNEWFGLAEESENDILNLLGNKRFKKSPSEIRELTEQVYEYRTSRMNLKTDKKILTSWNGLMLAVLAKAYSVLNDEKYLNAAKVLASLITEELACGDNKLYVRLCGGEAAGEGLLDDYAYSAFGLLELYEVTGDKVYLDRAAAFSSHMAEQFFDFEKGGFYLYSKDGEQLIYRPKELYDGALPSGNSVAAYVMIKLFKLTGEIKWRSIYDRQIDYTMPVLYNYPMGYAMTLLAIMEDEIDLNAEKE